MKQAAFAACICALCGITSPAQTSRLPSAKVVALDGHTVLLPRDLQPLTVMIVGFSRGSAEATTAWEIPVRTRLAGTMVGFYDVAVLASVPGLLHGWVTRSIRSKVPPVLQPHFLPVFSDEDGWKQVCGYHPQAPDAAYIVLVDRSGNAVWKTHEPYAPDQFRALDTAIRNSAGAPL